MLEHSIKAEAQSPARVLAVIVAYNPDTDRLTANIASLSRQVDQVLLVDNGSVNLLQTDALNDNVAIESLGKNKGLGFAHNRGIAYAREHGFDYVVLFDQDSAPSENLVQHLVRAHRAKSVQTKVGAVGAIYDAPENGHRSFFVRFGWLKFKRVWADQADADQCIEADFLISSGSLYATNVFASVGDMDETLFIDHIDTEWFLRAKGQGYSSYGVVDALMQHDLGEATHRLTLGGRERNVPQHKPFRYYYIFRNSLLLYRTKGYSRRWKWNDVQRLMMIFFVFGLLKPPRYANFTHMIRGIGDGLKGVRGPQAASINESRGELP